MKISTLNHPFFATANIDCANEITPTYPLNEAFTDWGPLLRKIGAIALAPMVTFGLLVLMQSLIQSDLPEPEPHKKIVIDGIFDVPKPIDPPPKEPPKKIIEVEAPPTLKRVSNIELGGEIESGPIDVTINVKPDPGSIFESDSVIRLVAVQPQYPQRAIAQGIEGYVDVRFDITAAGTTENTEIIAYEPSKVFNRAVLQAVSRWRYQPKTVDGKAVETLGKVERLTFQLEN